MKSSDMSALDAKLFSAAIEGNINNVMAFLKRGASASKLANTTLLTSLAERGSTEVLAILIDAGADPDGSIPETGITALMWAASTGHYETTKMLVEKGAEINNFAVGKYGSRINALMYAVIKGNMHIVDLLIEHGADVNACLANSPSALMWAARNGHLDVLKKLLDTGADVNAITPNGTTALHFAKNHHHTLVAEWLKAKGAKDTPESLKMKIQGVLQFRWGKIFGRLFPL